MFACTTVGENVWIIPSDQNFIIIIIDDIVITLLSASELETRFKLFVHCSLSYELGFGWDSPVEILTINY